MGKNVDQSKSKCLILAQKKNAKPAFMEDYSSLRRLLLKNCDFKDLNKNKLNSLSMNRLSK